MNKPADLPLPSRAALEMIDRLIAFRTVCRDSKLGLIEWGRATLAALGVKSRLSDDSARREANRFATLADDSARVKAGGIALSGHTDTVPVDGQDWSSAPFSARHADGRVYGRGSADMKGFIAIAQAMAPQRLAAQDPAPVRLALSCDEEVGCSGGRGRIADLAERGVNPAACVIGEPTDMQLIVAHKAWHRGESLCSGRNSRRLAGAGIDRAGASARRIHHRRADRRARGFPRSNDRRTATGSLT